MAGNLISSYKCRYVAIYYVLLYNVPIFVMCPDADCNLPDCPGEPNCMGHGDCDMSFDPPECRNCSVGWYGPACDDVCLFGAASPNNSLCICNTTCMHGPGCDVECSFHGTCNPDYTCYCDPMGGWSGDLCEVLGSNLPHNILHFVWRRVWSINHGPLKHKGESYL